jgi:hypothetical protein
MGMMQELDYWQRQWRDKGSAFNFVIRKILLTADNPIKPVAGMRLMTLCSSRETRTTADQTRRDTSRICAYHHPKDDYRAIAYSNRRHY